MDAFQQFAGVDAAGKLLTAPLALSAGALDEVSDLEIESIVVIGHGDGSIDPKGRPVTRLAMSSSMLIITPNRPKGKGPLVTNGS
jgi:hypothetical protein